jgi:hypothetical protein
MVKSRVWIGFVMVLSVGCNDPLGPSLRGRWAAPGIELVATNGIVELRRPCVQPFRGSRFRPVNRDRIEFAGRMSGWSFSYEFAFTGHLEGDTLVAAVTVSPTNAPVTTTYRMTPDGDSRLDSQVCAL